jgi:hypothetical protein
MCDYSLHAVGSQSTTTRGFASPDNPQVAVCLRPGTEIAFGHNVQTARLLFGKDIGERLARFRQIDLDQPTHHHDALEFSNGAIVLVTDLIPGQRATVLQLPANFVMQRLACLSLRPGTVLRSRSKA